MCGRYTARLDLKSFVDFFALQDVEYYPVPRYNIAPTQLAPVVVDEVSSRRISAMRWGLKAPWSGKESTPRVLINARGETLSEKRTFRGLLEQRCLIVADGYYEWATIEGRKAPYYVHLARLGPMAFAGLWQEADGERTFAITTVAAREDMATLHHRMPLVLTEPDELTCWLRSPFEVAHSLVRTSDLEFIWHEVAPIVNHARHDTELCIQPVSS